jgi:hypothetical protein
MIQFLFNFQGKEIIDFFIEELRNEGITHVPQWEPKEGAVVSDGQNDLETSTEV